VMSRRANDACVCSFNHLPGASPTPAEEPARPTRRRSKIIRRRGLEAERAARGISLSADIGFDVSLCTSVVLKADAAEWCRSTSGDHQESPVVAESVTLRPALRRMVLRSPRRRYRAVFV